MSFLRTVAGCGGAFESAVLLNASVRAELEGYTLVLVDVTDPGSGEKALQGLLGFWPVLAFENGGALAESLRGGQEPEVRARMEIDTDDEAEMRRRFLALLG